MKAFCVREKRSRVMAAGKGSEKKPKHARVLRVLDRLFALPPIEKRRMSQGFLRTHFLPQRFTLRSDDTYIYYLCARDCFFVTTALLFLNWVSLVWQIDFDLYFFRIDLPEKGFIEAFANTFPFYTSTLLLCTMVPFYLFKLFYNVNPKKVDVLWWVVKFSPKFKKSRWKVIAYFFYILAISLVSLFVANLSVFYYEDKLSLEDSYGFMLVLFFVFCALFSIMPMVTAFSIAALYRYIGPYEGPLSSSSIREGEQS